MISNSTRDSGKLNFPWTNRSDKKHIKDLVIGRSTDCTFEVINEQKVSGVYTAGLC